MNTTSLQAPWSMWSSQSTFANELLTREPTNFKASGKSHLRTYKIWVVAHSRSWEYKSRFWFHSPSALSSQLHDVEPWVHFDWISFPLHLCNLGYQGKSVGILQNLLGYFYCKTCITLRTPTSIRCGLKKIEVPTFGHYQISKRWIISCTAIPPKKEPLWPVSDFTCSLMCLNQWQVYLTSE